MKNSYYTVSKLSKISKVSVRTLHYYDEIGLLKPAYLGSNGYRYYMHDQLLKLQEILFLKELGFELKKIKFLLHSKNYEKISALNSHRSILKKELTRLKTILKTVDNTIGYLKGEIKMSEKELFFGFNSAKQKDYEKYILENFGETGQKLYKESQQRVASWDQNDWQALKEESIKIHKALAEAQKKDLAISSEEVQQLVDQHYHMVARFYDPSKDVYLGLGELYVSHPDYQHFFDEFGPNLAEYLKNAMIIYAETKLA